MNIQIFGIKKCFDTKKAERYFKERGIKYQFIDMKEKGMSRGEFSSVKQAIGSVDDLLNENCKDKELMTLLNYLSDDDKEKKILDNPQVIRTPVVRNGSKATIGYCPDIWKSWE
jgi:arsenate reductase-like glutaredoxin family protein